MTIPNHISVDDFVHMAGGEIVALPAEVLANLSCERAWICHGEGGFDEIVATGRTWIAELKDGKVTVGNAVDDTVLTAKVKSALLGDAAIKSFDVAVVTRKGEVQLSGFANDQNQIDRAIQVAKSVEGVAGVKNEMSVKK